ncbi:hypothetical protein IQ268_08710 [Oculatella sp. LEGE 06141]|uniref:hypothetical protein n=1 Tax=Oculatella sp. LEGE 06141 TaxID=1828648 RepID=UPI001882547C|nr:hypothetical protein [Oculatella sp. LEGE 06141]MBE9178639.1 hypothetical protein [Oculatella sp. LEGE 06141]
MPTAQLLEDYTRDDVRRELLIWADRELSVSQFYEWLPFCLVQRKPLYGKRDVAKFLFIANHLKRDRSLERAKTALLKDLNQHPERYPND